MQPDLTHLSGEEPIIGNRIGYFERIEKEQADLIVIKKMINRLISALKRKDI